MKIVMDCDTGHDDALALLLAARHLDFLGVTTVYGSSSVLNTTDNTLRILDLAGIDVPVTAGCDAPFMGRAGGSPTHGKTGMDGATLPPAKRNAAQGHAVDYLISAAKKYRGDLVIIATGPLTNLACALKLEPKMADWVGEVSIMGGSAGVGNRTPVAEANFATDPEAAAIVLSSGLPCRLVGYELTRSFGLAAEDIARLAQSERAVARAVAGFQQFYLDRQKNVFGLPYAPIHDPCAVLHYINPSCLCYEEAFIQIELAGNLTRGMSVYDRRGTASPQGTSIQRATTIDTVTAISLVLESIQYYR